MATTPANVSGSDGVTPYSMPARTLELAIANPRPATHPSIATLAPDELRDFADLLKQVLVRFDNLWQMPFPYVMPLHQAPTDSGDYSSFHFHIEIHPPLRLPNLLKYLAGPEIGGGNFLSDTAPEEKAAELRLQQDIHYKHALQEQS